MFDVRGLAMVESDRGGRSSLRRRASLLVVAAAADADAGGGGGVSSTHGPHVRVAAVVAHVMLVLLIKSVTHTHTHTHTHQFNGPLSGNTRASRYQKGKTNVDFTGARDSYWQWHQQGHMQVCTSLQTDSHASTAPLSK